MTTKTETMSRAAGWFGGGLGLAALVAYVNFAFGTVVLSEKLALTLAFAIGPVAIFGTISLCDRLAAVYSGTTLRFGQVYLIIAFSLLTLMLTMQQAVFHEYDLQKEGGASSVPESLANSFALVNQVQLGADVAFDIFYALGILVVSGALVSRAGVSRIVGGYGFVSAAGLLALNLWFFPTPPAAAGGFDLGPATIVWWVGLIVLEHRIKKSGDHHLAPES